MTNVPSVVSFEVGIKFFFKLTVYKAVKVIVIFISHVKYISDYLKEGRLSALNFFFL